MESGFDFSSLPRVQGEILPNAPIGDQSWFRCGGRADCLYLPKDTEDLSAFLTELQRDMPVSYIGGLANTIVRDGGVRGVTFQLGKAFSKVCVLGDAIVEAQAGALNGSVAAAAVKAGIGGLEFLSGIPGSMGGALAMNAGAYGREMKDVLIAIEGVAHDGKIVQLTRDDLIMSYRYTDLPPSMVVTKVIMRGVQEGYEAVKTRMNDIKAKRLETQPIKEKTGGSTFANPSVKQCQKAGLDAGTRAWQLVDMVGGRGFSIGGAQMSEKHCNFMINTGDACAAHLEDLGDEMIRRIYEKFGLKMRWEIKRIGERVSAE